MTRMLPLAAVVALFAAPAAQAQLIAYDGFAYPTGPLNGQNGGSGWAGAWAVSSGTVVVQPGSLAPPAPSNTLSETGNSVSATGSLNPGTATRALPSASAPGTAGTVSWLSAVMKGPGSAATTAGGTMTLTNSNGDGFSIATGTSTSADWSVTDAGTGFFASSSTVLNSLQSLLVVRETYGSVNDTFDLFINPALTGSPPATPDASVMIPHVSANLDTVEITGFSLGTSTTQFDEVRLGATFADVTPVPEPSTLVLAGAAGLGLVLRRRRR